jgi:phosphoglycolate phosphatase-like HAD superfamily hydrolase
LNSPVYRTVIFDIDGTLADMSHRQHVLDHGNYHANSAAKWAAFFAGIPQDKPVEPLVSLALSLYEQGVNIVLCTGRSETNREATELWLERYGVPYDALIMRATDCMRPDYIVKEEMLDRLLADGHAIWFVVDDRKSVVDMWRRRGLMCLQCAEGNF